MGPPAGTVDVVLSLRVRTRGGTALTHADAKVVTVARIAVDNNL